MARNLQNYSRVEDLLDIKEILHRSRYEWLDSHDVINIMAVQNNLPTSTEMVEPFKEGLFLFHSGELTDANDWDFNGDRVTQPALPIYYQSSRLPLVPLDIGMRSNYWRRTYYPAGASQFKIAQYIIVHLPDDVLSSDDSGMRVTVLNTGSSSEEEESGEEDDSADEEESGEEDESADEEVIV
ncbi:PREDICTED: uncharacterized protein LOC104791056 [Camelina sativa]|uniref:Uncharacterized protein LOC104791056 n=1 Tax=Camelina sativa TaxID=90675 RepID=A0ABM1RHD6_CAMSA|nr:PREDICTED: uncharacterized protein LOC104791056 [Camelina sativa]XP_019098424.1 PREDICTED: uncharacterized protein LOC104791056 [Camelina sativa]